MWKAWINLLQRFFNHKFIEQLLCRLNDAGYIVLQTTQFINNAAHVFIALQLFSGNQPTNKNQ